eukprot:5840304-Alexandrium_andersonii.AAC.1
MSRGACSLHVTPACHKYCARGARRAVIRGGKSALHAMMYRCRLIVWLTCDIPLGGQPARGRLKQPLRGKWARGMDRNCCAGRRGEATCGARIKGCHAEAVDRA